MGIARTQDEETERREFQDFRQTLIALAAMERSKENEDFKSLMNSDIASVDLQDKLVCITSGVSFLGLALVNRLLLHGYSVRILVDNQEDVDKLREMQVSGEMMVAFNNKISVVMAKPTEFQGLMEAFDGHRGVFHTSAFADPAGISGYSKSMAEIEAKASENVMKACARTASVRNCVLTSSLLAAYGETSPNMISPLWLIMIAGVMNHYAWTKRFLSMACIGEVDSRKSPEFSYRNPTATIAYLEGAQEMYANGLLATFDVIRLAEAYVSVYEAMNKTASGRYI
ncbi:hypothetical protein V6N13_094129 [Hibiscus sabdariffa]|uniref:Uncharacterized protein n=2 Tax=Hibiscus sabdariffa TaxID=183260 RepID=A0ABR1ZVL4_9ROSI